MKLFVKEDTPRKKHGCLFTVLIIILVYVAFCALMGLSMSNSFKTPTTRLQANTIYQLDLDGTLVEQAPQSSPLDDLLSELPGQFQQDKKVGLDQLLSNIALAKNNDKVLGIYLHGGSLITAPASAKAIRDALLDFKQSGKFIIAYADSYGMLNYYIASVADRICFNTVGSLSFDGLSAQKMYYTRLLDKIGVEVQILKVGTFKSAVEPFFCTEMSPADREQTTHYLHGIWSEIKHAVSLSRHLTPTQLDDAANHMMSFADPQTYIQRHLVDTLVHGLEMDSILRIYAGTKDFHLLTTPKMATVKRTKIEASDQIAVLYAQGQIYSKEGDGITDTDIIKQVKKITRNSSVKAVVFRVNSPGGSADASEQIWHAITTLQQKGLPVVVSMGDYAASGGYYISCMADYIFAEPTTLTGSIGIFGMVPNTSKLRNRIGLDVDGVGTNTHSLLLQNAVLKGLNQEEFCIMQSAISRGYDTFTARCAQGRNMPQSDIKKIGEGRVWLGTDALQLGLIDELGNIQDAIAKAAELAQLGAYNLCYYPEQKDFFEQLLQDMEKPDTEEEQLLLRLRTLTSQPRIMALMPEVTIQ